MLRRERTDEECHSWILVRSWRLPASLWAFTPPTLWGAARDYCSDLLELTHKFTH